MAITNKESSATSRPSSQNILVGPDAAKATGPPPLWSGESERQTIACKHSSKDAARSLTFEEVRRWNGRGDFAGPPDGTPGIQEARAASAFDPPEIQEACAAFKSLWQGEDRV